MTRWHKNLQARCVVEAENAQGLAEYTLLLTLLAIVGTSAVTTIGQVAANVFFGAFVI